MATYYNLKSLKGLQVADKIIYNKTVSGINLNGYIVNVKLHGKNGNNARALNSGYSYITEGGTGGETYIWYLSVPKDYTYTFTTSMSSGVCFKQGSTIIAVAGNGGAGCVVSDNAIGTNIFTVNKGKGGAGGGSTGADGTVGNGVTKYAAKGGSQSSPGAGGTTSGGLDLELNGYSGSGSSGGRPGAGYVTVSGTTYEFTGGYGGDGYYGGGGGSASGNQWTYGITLVVNGGGGGSGYFNKAFSDMVDSYSLSRGGSSYDDGQIEIQITGILEDTEIEYIKNNESETCEVYYHNGTEFKLCKVKIKTDSEFSDPVFNADTKEFEIGG